MRASWASSDAVRRSMRGNRSYDTGPELALRRTLRAMGITGYRLRRGVPGLPYRQPDMLFVGRRLAIFVDGCFWHRCPEHWRAPTVNRDYWEDKAARNAARDRSTDFALARLGWRVVRVWEHEGPEEGARRVAGALAEWS